MGTEPERTGDWPKEEPLGLHSPRLSPGDPRSSSLHHHIRCSLHRHVTPAFSPGLASSEARGKWIQQACLPPPALGPLTAITPAGTAAIPSAGKTVHMPLIGKPPRPRGVTRDPG